MRIARFVHAEGPAELTDVPSFGVVEGEGADLSVTPLAPHPFGPFQLAGEQMPLSAVRLLAPVLPTKVVAIGKNYAAHAAEMGGPAPPAPVLFLKPSTSVVGPGDPIRLPPDSERVDHEAELAVVIGRLTRGVTPEAAFAHILGFTCANDVTARDQQRADGQWARAKGHDSFCPLGPWIETDLDVSDIAVRCRVTNSGGEQLRQDASTAELIHSVADLIAFISAGMTLLPGDVVLTGTPAGVGPLVAGDLVTVSVEGIGDLINPVMPR